MSFSLMASRVTKLVPPKTWLSCWNLAHNKHFNMIPIMYKPISVAFPVCYQSSLRMMKEVPKFRLRTHAINVLNGNYDDMNRKDIDPSDYEDEDTDFAVHGADHSDKTSVSLYDSFEDTDKEDDEEELTASILEMQRSRDAEKQRRLAAAQPIERVQEIDEKGRAYGRGGRKTATARVWIQPGEGLLTINRREFFDYFPRDSDREMIISPFVATNTCGQFDVTVAVEGGGVTGKAGAIRHGISRALEKYNPEYRPPLKRLGFLTRDPRMVERKKIGHKKARKKPQWVRR
jgi:small subunit ribosomal protein S9